MEKEHLSNITLQKYTTFTSINNPLNKDVLTCINTKFSPKSIAEEGDFHSHVFAFQNTLDCYRNIEENNIIYTNFITVFDFTELQYIVDNVIEPVMDIFPKGCLHTKRMIKLSFIDDTRKNIENQEDTTTNYDGPFISQHISKPLNWHQDIWDDTIPYRYIFFTVTYLYGISDHRQELGIVHMNKLVFNNNLAKHVVDDNDVTILCSLPSQEGSGYAIDQSSDIVHRHNGYKTYISNFDIKHYDYLINVKKENFIDYKNITTNNNIKSDDYKTPRRYKLIMRISDDIPM